MEISNDTLMLIATVNIALTMGSAIFGGVLENNKYVSETECTSDEQKTEI